MLQRRLRRNVADPRMDGPLGRAENHPGSSGLIPEFAWTRICFTLEQGQAGA